jgi:hypothetical protein
MKKLVLFAFTFIVMAMCLVKAQNIQVNSPYHDYKSVYLKTKVKLLDEFIKRFNGDYSYLSDSLNQFSRNDKLRFIINYEYWQTDSTKIESFINSVIQKDFKIQFQKNNWYAEVECAVKYKRSLYNVILNMQIETDSLGRNRWTLVSAKLPFITQDAVFNSDDFINPVNNEVGFSGFHKMLSADKVLAITNTRFNYNHLSVFLFLQQTDQMEFEQVNEITYVFYTSEYCFRVNNFNREHLNSGWLISNITCCNLPSPVFYPADVIQQQWENQNLKLMEIINSKSIF